MATQYWHKIRELERALNQALKRIEFLEAENIRKDVTIAKQEERITELEEENRKLKGQGKSLKEMIFKKRTKQEGESQRGARQEHKAFFRRKPGEEEINNETEVTLRQCPSCDSELGDPYSWNERFSWDIPIPIEPIISRHHIAQYHCGGCDEWVQGVPKNLVGKSPFGINVMMYVLHQKYRGRATDEHIRESLKFLYQLEIGKGTVHTILNRCTELFGSSYEGIKRAIREGKHVHADETGWRVEGENWYTWGFTNPKSVLYTIENTRGYGVPKEILKDFKGVVVRDGYQGYDKLPNEHQICLIHLLRKTKECAEMEKASEEMKRLHEQLKSLITEARENHVKCRTKEQRIQLHDEMQTRLASLWRGKTYKDNYAQTIRTWWLERRHQHLLTFLKYKDVPWENNAAERALRPMVIHRKVSGGSRSERGAQRHAINMSVLATLVKQGKSIFEEIPLIFEQTKKENSKKLLQNLTC